MKNLKRKSYKTVYNVNRDRAKNKCVSFIEKIPYILTIIFCSFIFITLLTMIIIDKSLNKIYIPNEVNFSNIILFPLIFVTILLLVFINIKKINNVSISNKKFYIGLCIYFVIIFVVQAIISYSIYFYTDWDVAAILRNAKNIGINGANGLEYEYFSENPNNIVLTYSLALLYKIGHIVHSSNPYIIILGVISFLVCLSIFCTAICIHKITKSKRITSIFTVLGTILIALSPWIVIPYSDQIGMIFPILALTAYLFIKNEYAKNIIITILCVVGYFYKPTIIIFLIAYIIVRLFAIIAKIANGKKLNYKKYISIIVLMIISTVGVYGGYKLVKSFNKTELNKQAQMTMTHFFMMGLSERSEGRWDREDVLFSKSFPNIESRQKGNIDESIKRIKNMKLKGLTKHLIKKNMLNYNNGTFGWGGEGVFYKNLHETDSKLAKSLRSLYYNRGQLGKYYQVFATVEQFIWILVLTCICFNYLKQKDEIVNQEATSIISTTLMGVSLFLLLFECRARYLYIFSPLFIVLAATGMNNFKNTIEIKRENIQSCKRF